MGTETTTHSSMGSYARKRTTTRKHNDGDNEKSNTLGAPTIIHEEKHWTTCNNNNALHVAHARGPGQTNKTNISNRYASNYTNAMRNT